MSYTKRYPGGFKNLPDTTTPVDATFLDGVENALEDHDDRIETLESSPGGGGPISYGSLTDIPTSFTPATHSHPVTDITSLAEYIRDTIGSTLVAGANVDITVNDVADTITIASTGSGGSGLDAEAVRDTIATALIGGTNIAITYNDAADTITVATTGLGGAAALNVGTTAGTVAAGDHTHSGFAASSHTHTIANVTGLQTALDGKQAAGSYAAAVHTHTTANITGLDTALAGKTANGGGAATIVVLTEAAYAALGTKDANTLYFTTET